MRKLFGTLLFTIISLVTFSQDLYRINTKAVFHNETTYDTILSFDRYIDVNYVYDTLYNIKVLSNFEDVVIDTIPIRKVDTVIHFDTKEQMYNWRCLNKNKKINICNSITHNKETLIISDLSLLSLKNSIYTVAISFKNSDVTIVENYEDIYSFKHLKNTLIGEKYIDYNEEKEEYDVIVYFTDTVETIIENIDIKENTNTYLTYEPIDYTIVKKKEKVRKDNVKYYVHILHDFYTVRIECDKALYDSLNKYPNKPLTYNDILHLISDKRYKVAL